MATKDHHSPPKSLENGDVPGKDDIEAFIGAATMGDIDTVMAFLAKWPRAIDEKDAHTWTALMHAALTGHETIVDTLIKHGANVGEKDKWGRSVWVLARRKGNHEIIGLIEDALKKKRN